MTPRSARRNCGTASWNFSNRPKKYAKNIDVFLGGRLHDSKILAVKFEKDCLSILIEDLVTLDFFCAARALLGIDVPDDYVCCPVLIQFEGVRSLDVFTISDEGLAPAALADVLPEITDYAYDEISKINPSGISIGLILGSVLLDIDARRIRIEENTKNNFVAIFGSENIDVFDAYQRARNKRLAGWDNTEFLIRLIRSLRPKKSEAYDIQDYYIWADLKIKAEDAAKKGKLDEAVEIYKELIPSHWNRWIIWEKLGECLFKLKRYSEAMLYLHAVLGLNKNDVNARYLLAQTWHRLDNPEDAAAELMKCLKIDPKHAKAKRFIKQHDEIRKIIEGRDGGR